MLMLRVKLLLPMGEISTNSYVDISNVVRKVIISIGYNDLVTGFDGNTCGIISSTSIYRYC